MDDQLTEAALDYHRLPTPGKISILPTSRDFRDRTRHIGGGIDGAFRHAGLKRWFGWIDVHVEILTFRDFLICCADPPIDRDAEVR